MRKVASLSLSTLLLVAGCGSGASERSVGSVVDRFQTALAARDGGGACAELRAPTRRELESQEKRPCSTAIFGLELPRGGRAGRVRVYMTSALAQVDRRDSVFLEQTAHGWRISAAGCHPTSSNRPYDCRLKD